MSSSRKITSALALATAAFVSAPVAIGTPARADSRRRVENGLTPLWWIEHKLGEITGQGGAQGALNDARRRVQNELRRVSAAVGQLQSTSQEARRTTTQAFESAVSEVGRRTSLSGLSHISSGN
jgi:TolA-binding protein